MRGFSSVGSVAICSVSIARFNAEAIFARSHSDRARIPTIRSRLSLTRPPAGLGLPERDYYFKDDEKSKETRQKYVEHVAAMFVLAGSDKATAEGSAKVVMRMETAFAGASLTNVELRDPHATDHKMKLDEVQKLTPDFNWSKYFKQSKVDPSVAFNVDQPKFLEEFQKQLKDTSLADWKIYLTWQVLLSAAPSLSTPFVQEDFAFNHQYLQAGS